MTTETKTLTKNEIDKLLAAFVTPGADKNAIACKLCGGLDAKASDERDVEPVNAILLNLLFTTPAGELPGLARFFYVTCGNEKAGGIWV